MSNSTTLQTVEEMADRLRVPKSWLYQWTRRKDEDAIPCVRVGKYIRFREHEVMEWLEKKQGRL